MKPFHSLAFLVSVFLVLSALAYIFPENGIKISNSISLKFYTLNDLFKKKNSADISSIIESAKKNEIFDTQKTQNIDTLLNDTSLTLHKQISIEVDTVLRQIEFPENNQKLLNSFFASLSNISQSNDLVRILHYGDSQIEADRITSYIRNRLQSQFGGLGGGFLPAISAFDYNSPMVMRSSSGWKRYSLIGGGRDSVVAHRRYGILASFCRFSPIVSANDTSKNSDFLPQHFNAKNYYAWISYANSKFTYSAVRNYKQCRLFYGYSKSSTKVKLFDGNVQLLNDSLPASTNLSIKKWTFQNTPENLRIQFESTESPDIFGVAFDGNRGIAVDNIPMRGSSGTFFTMMNPELMAQMYKQLHVKLILLQFGGNTVPYLELSKIPGYGKFFYSQLIYLRKLCPDIPIIVMGVQDMSKKDKDQFVSYPTLKALRDEMKNVSFKAGCAYWDIFEAMGGENSMPAWVSNDPALAEKDYMHFSQAGANLVARMFYNAFMFEYSKYLKSTNKPK